MTRVLLALVLAFGLSAVPLVSVRACSCVMLGGPPEVIAAAEFAFLGTVVDTAPGGDDRDGFGPTVRYAFQVERASAAMNGGIVEVRAIDDGGGASCGFTFGEGERWFVAANEEGGSLHTTLCSGNLLVETMAEDELDRVTELLPVVPDPPGSEVHAEAGPPILPVLGGLVVIGLVAVTFLAFRRNGSARPS